MLDVTVRRNGYGRQRESFEAPLAVRGLADGAFPGVFIRAPVVERVGAGGRGARRVRRCAGARPAQAHIWFASFHPELSGDLRLHQLFVNRLS